MPSTRYAAFHRRLTSTMTLITAKLKMVKKFYTLWDICVQAHFFTPLSEPFWNANAPHAFQYLSVARFPYIPKSTLFCPSDCRLSHQYYSEKC